MLKVTSQLVVKAHDDNNDEDEYCSSCHGSGQWRSEKGWHSCSSCRGKGRKQKKDTGLSADEMRADEWDGASDEERA